MKKVSLCVLVFFVSFSVFSQKKDKVLLTIDATPIKVSEFKRVYEKNLGVIEDSIAKDVAKNLDLFINYKLKVREAYAMQLDTLPAYKREIEGYKNQLAAPYLQDDAFTKKLIEDTYYRIKNELKASHILIKIPKNFEPKDTLEAYNKIIAARDKIVAGASFESVAREVSEDPSVKTNGGSLGYFGAFKMVFDFEDAAYNTKIGEVSQPFRTRFGYHIVKPEATRVSKGEIEIAHILVTDSTLKGKGTIDTVYQKLQQGAKFKDLAKQYSNDVNSKNKGGKLRRFGKGMMIKPYEEKGFALENKGDFTPPFKTRYGWHILQLIEKYPVQSFEEMKEEVAEKVKRTGRINLSDKVVLDRLKKQYTIVENEPAKWILKSKKIQEIPLDSLQDVLLRINEKEIYQSDFVKFSKNRRGQNPAIYYTTYVDQQVLSYFKENLVHTSPEYAYTLQEYQEGLLLFELMQQKIWDKSAKDTLGLQNFFNERKSTYNAKELQEIRGKVISDYQTFLEDEWIAKMKKESVITIRKRQLKKLIKQYKKQE